MMVTRVVVAVLVGVFGAAAVGGCGDDSGGTTDAQAADGGDTADGAQTDVFVPGPGECELNWVEGFSPLAVVPYTWVSLEPSQQGTLYFAYNFFGGPGTPATIDIQSCRLVDGAFQLSASSEDKGDLYVFSIDAPSFPGLGVWQPHASGGLTVELNLLDPTDHSNQPYLSKSTSGSQCEICVDATGRPGAFRCDDLLEEGGDRGGIRRAGFKCPEGEPGFLP